MTVKGEDSLPRWLGAGRLPLHSSFHKYSSGVRGQTAPGVETFATSILKVPT